MLLGVMLLYVGAVLIVNGIWLIGQARGGHAPAARTGTGGVAEARSSSSRTARSR